MLQAVSLGDWFRRLFSSPAESAEEDAALHEEYGATEEDAPDVPPGQPTIGGGLGPGVPGLPAAGEAAEAEIESEEAPPDQAP
jgi:hypothetical protein